MNRIGIRAVAALLWAGVFLPAAGQQPERLTIWEAYRVARENYPSSKQRGLIEKTREYTLQNAARGYLPQLSFAGQATMQSDVTNLPIKIPVAGFSMPQYSKDQYKIYGEVDQAVYDGGMIHNQQEAARVAAAIQEKSLDVELHTLFDRVDQLYFGVLLLDAQLRQNDLLRQDIRNGLEKMQAMVDNGTAYKSGVDELQAQLLQAGETQTEENATRKGYLNMLLMLLGKTPGAMVSLTEPPELSLHTTISRPELLLFEFQQRNYDLQDEAAAALIRPRFSLFVQGGYSRPGLNMLSNNFSFYALGGIRMSWNLGGWYTLKRQRALSEIGRRGLDLQRETFLLNTGMQQEQSILEVARYTALLQEDGPIIELRTAVKEAALAQLRQGTLSAHDYLTQVNAEDQSRETRVLHRIQLLRSEYAYQTLIGH
ncbi:MAG TPA: TolC family protein [Puia sp.]|nr:TolC family protein [Puia sp.]